MKKNIRSYDSQLPNFAYDWRDYITVIKSMYRLQNWRKKTSYDERIDFENRFAKYIGKKYALSVNGGNTGIDIALSSLELQEGDEVISAAINFYGTHLSVLNTKANLILCGVDSHTLNITAEEISKKLSNKTKAILVTHMNGLSADMDQIVKIVKEYNSKIVIIEDVARSCGAMYNNVKVGLLGDISIYSFQGKKNISTLGEGGMILTNDFTLYNRMKKIREFGSRSMDAWGSNFKLSKVQCSVGIEQLKKIDVLNKKRINVALQRNEMLKKYQSEYIIPVYDQKYLSIYTYYTVILNEKYDRHDRDEIRKSLK